MPIKAVNKDLADTINNMLTLLQRDFGTDFSFQIMGNGMTIAKHNITGVQPPVPLHPATTHQITRFNVTTHKGNTLEFFYNPDNSLVVVDLVAANGQGGNELLRQTLHESKLLTHTK